MTERRQRRRNGKLNLVKRKQKPDSVLTLVPDGMLFTSCILVCWLLLFKFSSCVLHLDLGVYIMTKDCPVFFGKVEASFHI